MEQMEWESSELTRVEFDQVSDQLTEETLSLYDMFPELSPMFIMNKLVEEKGNVETTLDLLIEIKNN